MARNPEAIDRTLSELIQPEARGRLLALGLARGMVWRDGVVPEGVPERLSSATLTPDLLDFGYGILALALELRDANRERAAEEQFQTNEALRVAAEAIESAVRRGDPNDGDQGRHLVVSAAAFHLAGYAARSFSLLPLPALDRNLASHERCLAYLLRRDLTILRSQIIQWHSDPGHGDEAVAGRLLDENDEFYAEDAALIALTTEYHRALGLADTALLVGNRGIFDAAVGVLETVVSSAAEIGNVPIWWVATLNCIFCETCGTKVFTSYFLQDPTLMFRNDGTISDAISSRCLGHGSRPTLTYGLHRSQPRNVQSIRPTIL